MQNKSGLRRIAADRVTSLPWLPPPAGYIILIQDVAYGNRYKIARHQRLDRNLIRRGAAFPFETRVVRILEADNAAQAERDLHDELAPGAPAGEWFDLQRYPPAKPRPAPKAGMVSLRDLARNDVVAESLLQGSEIVDATSRASAPPTRAASAGRAPNRRRPRAIRWALLLMLIVIAGLLAAERSSDFRRFIDSILVASPPGAGSRRAASPTTKPDGAAPPSSTAATRITLAQPKLLLAERTETSIRINWHKMPQALRYQFGYSVNGGAYSAWKTVSRFTHKIAGLSPGDRVTFRLRALRDGVHSPLARIRARTLPAPSPTPIAPTATSTATYPPPTALAEGEIYYVKSRACARICASLNCAVADVFEIGQRIEAVGSLRGQRVNNAGKWIAFTHGEQTLFFHISHLSKAPPLRETMAEPSPTARFTRLEPTDDAWRGSLYAKTVAYLRRCARLSCEIVEVLPPGSEITVEQYVDGQRVDGSERWIQTTRESRYAYVHSSSLTSKNLEVKSTPQPTLDGGGEVYYVKARTPARTCPHSECERGQSLPPGMRVTVLKVVEGQPLAGDSRWVQFMYGGWNQYVHASALSRVKPELDPTAEPSPPATVSPAATEAPPTVASAATNTPAPTAAATLAPAVKYVVETAGDLNANVRACPSTSCAVVGNFAPGTEVDVIGQTVGETVYGTDVWLEIRLDGRSAYIHSELVAEAE